MKELADDPAEHDNDITSTERDSAEKHPDCLEVEKVTLIKSNTRAVTSLPPTRRLRRDWTAAAANQGAHTWEEFKKDSEKCRKVVHSFSSRSEHDRDE